MFDHDHEIASPSDSKYQDQHGKLFDLCYGVRKHYENFQTIDWLKDLMRNRIRHRNLRAQRRQSWKKRFIFWFDTWSGWICVLLVGVSAGRLNWIF
jgi:hypothetical protein